MFYEYMNIHIKAKVLFYFLKKFYNTITHLNLKYLLNIITIMLFFVSTLHLENASTFQLNSQCIF